MDGPILPIPTISSQSSSKSNHQSQPISKSNQVGTVSLYGIQIVSLVIEGHERLCLAQISNTLLKEFSYNEIHNRRVALGITCVQCTPVQLEILRRAGAMPPSSRRCGMITRREAERLCKSFLSDNAPPRLPDDFSFSVHHECAWGCRGAFLPSRYNSSRAKCIKCSYCGLFFSPNKFIFHSHQSSSNDKYIQPDAANFNSWRRHMKLSGNPQDDVIHAWEDVKAMFNGGTRKRLLSNSGSRNSIVPMKQLRTSPTTPIVPAVNTSLTVTASNQQTGVPRVPPFSDLQLSLPRNFVMDYMWHQHQQATAVVAATKTSGFSFAPYALPWLTKQGPILFPGTAEPIICPVTSTSLHQSAFRPIVRSSMMPPTLLREDTSETIEKEEDTEDEVDIETTEDDDLSVTHFENSKGSSHTNLNSHSIYNNSLPLCWSPPREMEKEMKKNSDDGIITRDIKPVVPVTKKSDNWQESAIYRRVNFIKGAELQDPSVPDCSACHPNNIFYSQIDNSPTSINQ